MFKCFKARPDALEWLACTKADIARQTFVTPCTITLGAWVLEYLKLYVLPNVRPTTANTYKHTAGFIMPLADIPLQELTARDVQAFYNSLPPPLSGSVKTKIHALLRRAIKKALALDVIKKDVTLNVTPPKNTPPKIEIFTVEEIAAIDAAFAVSRCWARYQLFFRLAISTGMRLGEILGLRVRSVSAGFLTVDNSIADVNGRLIDCPPKTPSSIRRVTISRTLAANLIGHHGGAACDYVFHTSNNTPLRPSNINRMWKAILKEAGIKYRHFHCLRHTHATQLLAAGVPLLEVAKRLGHAKTSYTVNLYGHAIPGYDAQIPGKVDALFFGAQPVRNK